jgi:transposase-like protein
VLGIWLPESEGAHFWLSVLSELKVRWVKDILIVFVYSLKGFHPGQRQRHLSEPYQKGCGL